MEDEASLRQLIAKHLAGRGHQVLEAADAETAIRHVIDAPVCDLVLTDVHLPGLSGVELLDLLKSRWPMTPVLVMTGDDQDALARRALAAGAAGYLLKPFQLSELEANVKQAIHGIELLERLGELDGNETMPSEFGVPIHWLEMADRRSGAGGGHGHRVERLAGVLARRMGQQAELGSIRLAARLHELGRLTSTDAADAEIPHRTDRILARLGTDAGVRSLVAGMAAWWAGDDGPAAESASLGVFLAADQLDHQATEGVRSGKLPPTAVWEAIDEVAGAAADRLGSEVAGALRDAQDVLSAIWILGRGVSTPVTAP